MVEFRKFLAILYNIDLVTLQFPRPRYLENWERVSSTIKQPSALTAKATAEKKYSFSGTGHAIAVFSVIFH